MSEDYIYRYSRSDALSDGILVDISGIAREAGFKIPVAVTSALYHGYLVPKETGDGQGQSLEGRTHDMLFLLLAAIRRGGEKTDTIVFAVDFRMGETVQTVRVKSVIGGGDDGEAVLTVMLEGED